MAVVGWTGSGAHGSVLICAVESDVSTTGCFKGSPVGSSLGDELVVVINHPRKSFSFLMVVGREKSSMAATFWGFKPAALPVGQKIHGRDEDTFFGGMEFEAMVMKVARHLL